MYDMSGQPHNSLCKLCWKPADAKLKHTELKIKSLHLCISVKFTHISTSYFLIHNKNSHKLRKMYIEYIKHS